MEQNDIEDRILHAKKLLKKHQHKNELVDDQSNNGEYQAGNFTKKLPLVSSTNERLALSIFNEQQYQKELSSLRVLCRNKDVEVQELTQQLQRLHNSYTEVYSAYKDLAQAASRESENAAALPSEYDLQISQLQTALAVSTEERTNLQFELRGVRAQLQMLEAESKQQQESSTTVHSLSTKLESEIIALKNERAHLFETIANQSQQIEYERKECSQLEAKILLVQQDRNEMQARLKFICEEKRNLETTLTQLRCDLNIKEIYIRQLSHFSENNPTTDQRNIQTLTEEREKASEEAACMQAQLVEMKKQLDSSRQHYESCLDELRQHISTLETENQRLSSAKTDLESVRSYHEEQLRLLKNEAADSKKAIDTILETGPDLEEFAALKDGYASLERDFLRSRERIQNLERTVEQKDYELETLQFDHINLQRKITDLEEANNFHTYINSDVNVLSEQLQNEKATVSRVVQQNIQLKSQLEELENKLISVTNESASKEDERITALNRVKALTERVEKLEKSYDNTHQNDFDEASKNDHSVHQSSEMVSNEILMPLKEFEIQTERSINYVNRANSRINDVQTIANTPFELCAKQNLSKGIVECRKMESDSKPTNKKATDSVAKLEARLHDAEQREVDLKKANERLEYLLTVLEIENESIGEYVALYRYQRENLQKKMRDRLEQQSCQRSAIEESYEKMPPPKCTHSSTFVDGIANGTKCSGCAECRGELVDL